MGDGIQKLWLGGRNKILKNTPKKGVLCSREVKFIAKELKNDANYANFRARDQFALFRSLAME